MFHAWAAPLPALSPNDGPIPTGPDTNLSFLAGGAAMGVLLAAFTVAVAVTGAAYLARVRPAGRAGTAWVSAVIAAAAAEVMLIGAFVDPGSPLGMAPGRVNWGLLVLAAFFAALGSSMISIIIAAARRARLLPAAR